MTKKLLGILAALGLTVFLMPNGAAHADPGPPAAGTTLSGVIIHGATSQTSDFGTWRGKPIDVIVDYLGGSTWASIEDASWTAHKWDAFPNAHIVWSMFMLPSTDSTATVQNCASTLYNSHYVAAGNSLVAAGYANATIRLGWENTGNWEPWGVNGSGSGTNGQYYYASCWRNEVKSLRQATGQHFTFDWNISDQHIDPLLGADPTTCATGCGMYPGDAYVDYVGGDFYDDGTSDPTQHVQSWTNIQKGSYGLDWLASFAAARGKRVTLPEWGVKWTCAGTWMGGDDPYYVYQVHRWVSQNNVAYELLFDNDDDSCHDYSQASGKFPTAYDIYRYIFGTYNG